MMAWFGMRSTAATVMDAPLHRRLLPFDGGAASASADLLSAVRAQPAD